MENRKPKVLWITNVANHYRVPMWKWLDERVDLTLCMLRDPESNRFGEWTKEAIGVKTNFVHAPLVARGNRGVFFPNRALRNMLKQDFDAVILGGWESPAYWYALFVAKKRGIRAIGHCGSTKKSSGFSKGVVARVRSWFHRKLDWSVTYGTDCTEYLVSMGVSENKITTGFNSIDNAYFLSKIAEFSEPSESSPGHKYLFVGRLIPLKNIPNIIHAFNQIKEPNDTLRIVGSGFLKEEILNLTSELRIKDVVKVIDHKTQDELIQEFLQANTLILASLFEVWGLVVNEALVCGLHVVVGDRCGVARDIKQMPGVQVSTCEVESIAQEMIRSRDSWHGHISNPEILGLGVEVYGNHFLEAILHVIR